MLIIEVAIVHIFTQLCMLDLCFFFLLFIFFFFQAEDGIRDVAVTGVQTCALPISTCPRRAPGRAGRAARGSRGGQPRRRRPAGAPGTRGSREAGEPDVGGVLLADEALDRGGLARDRKSTRLNSSHGYISYAVFCLKKKKKTKNIKSHIIGS